MKLFYKTFWLEKESKKPEEYEDALATPVDREEIELKDKLAFGIADGASVGVESKRWAEALVECFKETKEIGDEFWKKAYEKWEDWKESYIKERIEENNPLKWYEEEGLREGPFSTFLGILFDINNDIPKVKAIAVGDSCLFLVRDNELKKAFPISSSYDFSDFPSLVSLDSIIYGNLKVEKYEDDLHEGDEFYLLTDALAHWFLKEHESGNPPWIELSKISSIDEFIDFVKKLREARKVKNDDVTFIHIVTSKNN